MNAALHQASCVSIKGRGLLIEGPSGSGKSSLALALIDRGAKLVGDDGVMFEIRDGRLWAAPAPHISGLLEVRNVGLIEMPCEAAPVCLIIALDPHAPRHVETAEEAERVSCVLPMIRLWPDSPVLALRAEFALAQYGTD